MKRLLTPAMVFWICNSIALFLVVLSLWRCFYLSSHTSQHIAWLPFIGWLAFTTLATFALHEVAQSMIMELSSYLGIRAFTTLFACLIALFLPGLIFFGLYHWARFAVQQRTLRPPNTG